MKFHDSKYSYQSKLFFLLWIGGPLGGWLRAIAYLNVFCFLLCSLFVFQGVSSNGSVGGRFDDVFFLKAIDRGSLNGRGKAFFVLASLCFFL